MFGHRPLTLLAMLLSATAALAASEPTLPTPKIDVGVGEEFQLARQETALVRDLNLLVTVTGLSYTRCPKGAICVVPDGPVVVFEVRDAATGALAFTENNRASAPSRFPTFVRYVASDGETYARLAAHRTVDWCGRQVEKTAATWCWKRTTPGATCRGMSCWRFPGMCAPRRPCIKRSTWWPAARPASAGR